MFKRRNNEKKEAVLSQENEASPFSLRDFKPPPLPDVPQIQPAADIAGILNADYQSFPDSELDKGASMSSRPSVPTMTPPEMGRRVMELPGSRPLDVSTSGDKTMTVGRNIALSGEITACDHLVVDGHVEANLKDTSSLTVNVTGVFRGNVKVTEAHIHGIFEGDLVATRKILVYKSGRVTGSLTYASLGIEEGATVKGTITPLEVQK